MDAIEANYIANRRGGPNAPSIGEDYEQLTVGAYHRNRICTITHIVCPTHGISKPETLSYPLDNCIGDTGSYPEPVTRWLVCYGRATIIPAGREGGYPYRDASCTRGPSVAVAARWSRNYEYGIGKADGSRCTRMGERFGASRDRFLRHVLRI